MSAGSWTNGGLLQQGYPDNIGRKLAFCGPWTGPTSYSQTTKDPVVLPQFNNNIDSIHGSISVSGTYLVRPQPSGTGPRQTWKLIWVVISTGNEVANAVNLSAETVILSGYSSAY